MRFAEVATPRTIERYTLKNGGAVAGPKQMLGQHMFKRLHTRSQWKNFFCCGESTVMGTGTPTVTTSGISAANAILRKLGREPFVYRKDMKNVVRIVAHPFTADQLNAGVDEPAREVMKKAMQCRFCENPTCTLDRDIRGIMRRVAVGNFAGAGKIWKKNPADPETLSRYGSGCICHAENGSAVQIREVIQFIEKGSN